MCGQLVFGKKLGQRHPQIQPNVHAIQQTPDEQYKRGFPQIRKTNQHHPKGPQSQTSHLPRPNLGGEPKERLPDPNKGPRGHTKTNLPEHAKTRPMKRTLLGPRMRKPRHRDSPHKKINPRKGRRCSDRGRSRAQASWRGGYCLGAQPETVSALQIPPRRNTRRKTGCASAPKPGERPQFI